jgi:hypothetical protein
MGSQLLGDGGVYVSTQGPASYGLGSDRYELNIIKDCFGVERVSEYEGKGKLDVIIVYGCDLSVVETVSLLFILLISLVCNFIIKLSFLICPISCSPRNQF